MLKQSAKYRVAHHLWRWSLVPSALRFQRSLRRCREVQVNYLKDLLQKNRSTAYGRRHGFGRLRTVEAYQAAVPLTRYEDYVADIEKVAAGGKDVLTIDPVFLFEPSSGSTAAEKLIPYNRSLKREFLRGIAPWMAGMYRLFPGLSQGKAYWSISPAQRNIRRQGVIPVGFTDDAAYLGGLAGKLYSWMTIMPDGIQNCRETEQFRLQTLAALLSDPDLSFISVWSPSFLRIMLEWYLENRRRVLAYLDTYPFISPRRLGLVKDIGSRPGCFQRIWPKLCLVSCWAHGVSHREAELLSAHLPGVAFQGKGLIATEAFVSLPFEEEMDPVLAVRSHFFEFISESGGVHTAWELQKDRIYSVVVTTGGGLYRYQMDDRVLVSGFVGNTPTLRFVGKSKMVSDRFGEKLNALHVADALNRLTKSLNPTFCMLAPDMNGEPANYTLFVETSEVPPPELSSQLESALSENPNYQYCVALGQLGPARVFRITKHGSRTYEERCTQNGQRPGDVKLSCLSLHDGWSGRFQGEYQ